MSLLLFFSIDDLSLNYLYVAVTVAIRRRNRMDSAAVSIAATMGGMRNRNKVSESTYFYSNCDVAIVVFFNWWSVTQLLICCSDGCDTAAESDGLGGGINCGNDGRNAESEQGKWKYLSLFELRCCYCCRDKKTLLLFFVCKSNEALKVIWWLIMSTHAHVSTWLMQKRKGILKRTLFYTDACIVGTVCTYTKTVKIPNGHQLICLKLGRL